MEVPPGKQLPGRLTGVMRPTPGRGREQGAGAGDVGLDPSARAVSLISVPGTATRGRDVFQHAIQVFWAPRSRV